MVGRRRAQVPRILGPVARVVDHLPHLVQDPKLGAYVASVWGGVDGCRTAILVDFFRHAFDGAGADNFFDVTPRAPPALPPPLPGPSPTALPRATSGGSAGIWVQSGNSARACCHDGSPCAAPRLLQQPQPLPAEGGNLPRTSAEMSPGPPAPLRPKSCSSRPLSLGRAAAKMLGRGVAVFIAATGKQCQTRQC